MYPRLPDIEAVFNLLQSLENVNMLVERNNLVGYGQIISSACETVATTYNNFYAENFEQYIGNYFIYKLKVEYGNLSMSVVKKLVYNYIFDEVLTNIARSDMPEDFVDQDTLNLAPNLQVYIDRIIQPIKNRLLQLSLNKETITANPFTVLNVMAFILDLYEQKSVQA
ncbi:hypothetical protein BCV72DRAFT_329039 [Rhizopus microsporus var. microsporus]|uniref:Uncharacterized protein n=1 Tax=Rhizopus microsporus var. microsporus TaxID=86635 RepID=A0A1X0R2X9_RHIZD|nr:hypothetical protein BCV72DRAFT_329039 [Rhizopus microsporus var. microsporus]